ncbi:MAG: response regulator [Chloroflexi bacterium]|nr:response regulator [Chloroflexota bacterium]
MKQASILIVEDEVLVANDIATTLEELGYRVSGMATSGEEALRLAEKHKVNLVLMDIRLAGKLDGIEAAEEMRNRFELPVVYLTAHNDKQTIERAKITIPYSYILKPFEERELHVAIEMALYRHQAEARLKAQAEELEKAHRLEALAELARGFAHELNNILTIISGNLFLIELAAEQDSEIKQSSQEAEEAVKRAKKLAHRLLTFAGDGEPVRIELKLDKLVQEVSKTLLVGSGVELQMVMPENLWAIEADWEQLYQVIQHLVRNALEAMPQGGKLKIKAENFNFPTPADREDKEKRIFSPGRYLKLTIADEGKGILPEHLPKIFDPYFSTKAERTTERSTKSNGLGLAISYAIIKKHQGYIEVSSEQGKGAKFTLYLPVTWQLPDLPAEDPNPALVPIPPSSAPTKPRILVMDDEAFIRRLVVRMLTGAGYQVEVTSSGAETVERYQEAARNGEPFGLVILDLTVSQGMGGKETIEQLRQIDSRVNAIVSSGYANDPILANYRQYGFKGRLPKPYRLEDLLAVIQEIG